jgi:hypothetical protein
LIGPLDGDARYTLYPATRETLDFQFRVTEWGFSGSFCAYELRSFPHPARSDNAAKARRENLCRDPREWRDFLMRRGKP